MATGVYERIDQILVSLTGNGTSWSPEMISSDLRMLCDSAIATNAVRFPTKRPARKYNQPMTFSLRQLNTATHISDSILKLNQDSKQ
jgi:hypothetical protein